MASTTEMPSQLTKHCLKQVCESDKLANDMRDTVIAVQVVDVTIFGADKAKKNIKGRVTLSDGVSRVICMLPEKTHDQLTAQGEEVRKYDVWVFDAGKQNCQMVSNKPVMIMRSKPTVFGKYLTSEIGAPQDYVTNKESNTFPDSYDLRMPGAARPTAANTEKSAPALERPTTPSQAEERKYGNADGDAHMRSASTSKASKPAADYMPIKHLNQFTADWVIKARIIKKAQLREWKNPKSSGTLLNFDLVDLEGTQIQATAFNEAATAMDAIIEQNNVYTFKSGMVKLANKRFTSIKHDFCLTFSKDSVVEPCCDDDNIGSIAFNFTELSEIENMIQSRTVDVIGVILDVGPASSINMRDGKVKSKRTLTIGDESNSCIGVTLWGAVTEAHSYVPGQVIALKNCRVSDYNGKSLNATSQPSDIVTGQALREQRKSDLEAWMRGSAVGDLKDSMRQIGDAPVRGDRAKSNTPTLLIAQMKELAESIDSINGNKPVYSNLNCDLSWVFVPDSVDRQMFYMACESCKKKVLQSMDRYTCESCGKASETATPTYNFSIRVSDCSGSIILSCFGEIGDTILGMNAREFYKMHEDTAAVKDLTMNLLNQRQLALVVRGKIDEGRGYSADGPTVRYTAVRAAAHSFKTANENLLAQLTGYSAMPVAAEQMDDVAFF